MSDDSLPKSPEESSGAPFDDSVSSSPPEEESAKTSSSSGINAGILLTAIVSGAVAFAAVVSLSNSGRLDWLAAKTRIQWQQFDYPDGEFTAELPSKPRLEEKEVKSPFVTVKFEIFIATVNMNSMAAASVGEFQDGYVLNENTFSFDGAVEGIAAEVQGTVESVTKKTIASRPGCEFRIRLKNDGYLFGKRWYLGSKLYGLDSVQKGVEPTDLTKRVLASLKKKSA